MSKAFAAAAPLLVPLWASRPANAVSICSETNELIRAGRAEPALGSDLLGDKVNLYENSACLANRAV